MLWKAVCEADELCEWVQRGRVRRAGLGGQRMSVVLSTSYRLDCCRFCGYKTRWHTSLVTVENLQMAVESIPLYSTTSQVCAMLGGCK